MRGSLAGAVKRNGSNVEGGEFTCELHYQGNKQMVITGSADITQYPQLTLEVRHEKWNAAALERSRKWSLLVGVQARGRRAASAPSATPGATDEATPDNSTEVVEFGVFTRKQVGDERSTQRLTPQLLLQVHQRTPAGLALKLRWRPTAVSELKALLLILILIRIYHS